MDKVYNFLERHIEKGDSLVVAVSGGPDSMCLLNLLVEYKKDTDINIICAHVNHKVRIESDDEEKFVQEYCEKNNIVFECMRIEKYENDNFHAYARNKRYQFFEELIQKYSAKFLLTAHHGDDLVESILMRLVRGSRLKGYAGFESVVKRQNYTILRPLIVETKESILKYIQENNVNYVIDASNLKDVYTRNRYRKYILSELKKEEPFVHDKFKKFSDSLLEADDYITKQSTDILKKIYVDKELNLNKFKKIDIVLQKRVLEFILEDLYQEDIDLITDRHTELIFKLILSSTSNGYIDLPQNKRILKDRDILYFDIPLEEEYAYTFDEKQILPNGHVIEKISDTKENSNFICRLNLKDIELPLVIRTIKNGDIINVKNMTGTKKINDIFTDAKIPLLQRKLWPIVMDSTGKIVWLPGLKKSNFDIEKDEKCDIILKYY